MRFSDIEKKFFHEFLNNWKTNEFQNYETITFEILFVYETENNTYENFVSSHLNEKNSTFDFVMIDSIWTSRFNDHLINLNKVVSLDSINLYNSVHLNSCKYKDKLNALVDNFL